MMLIQTMLQGNQPHLRTKNCAVEKVVELSSEEYATFCSHLDDEYEFIQQT